MEIRQEGYIVAPSRWGSLTTGSSRHLSSFYRRVLHGPQDTVKDPVLTLSFDKGKVQLSCFPKVRDEDRTVSRVRGQDTSKIRNVGGRRGNWTIYSSVVSQYSWVHTSRPMKFQHYSYEGRLTPSGSSSLL